MAQSFRLIIVTFLCFFAWSEAHPKTPLPRSTNVSRLERAGTEWSPRVAAHAHQVDKRLKPGDTRTEQISRDETQTFEVELGLDEFAEVRFEWLGMNLGIAVLDPDGRTILPIAELSSRGPLSVSMLADKRGIYRLHVKPLVTQKIRGKYQVTLREPHLPTNEDRRRLEAQNELSQAQGAPSNQKIERYGKAITLFEDAREANGAARALMLLGDAHREARDFRNAKASYERAAEIWKFGGYQRGEAYAKISLGVLERSSGSLDAAVDYFKQAELLFAQIGDLRGEADAVYGQSFTRMILNRPVLAIPLLERVVQLRQSYGDLIAESNALNMMADAYRIIGEADKSAELYERATKNLTGLEHRSLEVAISINRALIDHDQGFWERARDGYAESLKLYELILEQPIVAACAHSPSSKNASECRSAAAAIDNFGQVYAALGDFDKAFEHLSTAFSIWTALDNKSGQGLTTLHIGYAKFLEGRLDEAFTDYQTALTLLKGAKNEAGIALTNTYLGIVHTSRNEPERALLYYREALPHQRATGDRLALAITLDNLGTAYQLTGNSREAMGHLSEALTLWRMIKDPDGEALTLYHRAMVEAATGDLVAANRSSEEAMKLLESFRTRLRAERSRTAYLAAKQDYYKLDIDLKMRLTRSENGRLYNAAAFETNEKARARVLLDSLAEADIGRTIVEKSPGSRLEDLRNQRDLVGQRLSAKLGARTKLLSGKSPDESIKEIDKDIADLTDSYDELERQIKSEDPRFAALVRPQPASLRQIQQQLDDETLLLAYSLGDSRSYVWAVTPDSIEGFELAPRKEIEAAADRLNKALTERNRTIPNESGQAWQRRTTRADADSDTAAAALSKLVLKRVAPLLGNKRLVIVADGNLQRISFAALPVPTSAQPANATSEKTAKSPSPRTATLPPLLIDDHEVVYEPSASVFALQRRELENRTPAPYAVAVLANPVFEVDDPRVIKAIARNRTRGNSAEPKDIPPASQNSKEATRNGANLRQALDDLGLTRFQALRYSGDEAKSIKKAAGQGRSKLALDFDANRAFAMSPELSKYRTIHFATHSVADFAHPELSGIVLSMVDEKGQSQDGHLRLHDIYNLNLPADLVVLSACQTAVGKQIKGEGLIALTRGFMYAGAQRVVASLWKVEDAATANLMAEFYDQMLTKKLKPAAALREAQRKISRQQARKSPYFWAGFVLQGEWK